MRVYITTGYIEPVGREYAVTDYFSKKYGLLGNKIEAPTADAEGAS